MMTSILSTLVLLAYQTAGAPSLEARPGPAAPTAGAATSGAAVPLTGGGAAPADPAAATGGSPFLIIMLLIVGGMIVFSMMGGRKERKKREQLLSSIKKHDRVLTVGGIVGSVVEMKDDTVILKVDEVTNTRITVSKTAISQILAGTAAE